MNIIIRWYNQNRKIIWLVIAIIIGIVGLIHTLNSFYKDNTKEESSSTNSATTYNNPNYSVITDKEISETKSQESIDLIKKFFNYCNNGNIQEAYNLLSQDCKEELYPSVDIFKNQYYNRIFTESKMYNSVLWISSKDRNTYRLEIIGDILATGQKESMPIVDYYTVISENEKTRLNISSYIGKENINISKTQDDVTITLLNKKTYMDYEKYEIKVKNETQGRITLNSKQNTDSMYIQDENDLKYIAFRNEISEYDLSIPRGFNRTYNIKFNSGYNPSKGIEKIIFDNMIVNSESTKFEIEL